MNQTSTKPKTLNVLVSRIIDECQNVKTFRLDIPENSNFDFIPGQFVMLNFPDNPKLKRAYSIASSPLEKGYIEITLNKVAEFTTRLFSLKGGETLVMSGPHGRWLYTDDVRHAVLISGGTGITPFRCITRYVLGKGLPNKITIVYSSRTPSDIIYRRELEDFVRRGVCVHNTITRPHLMAPGEEWDGPTGRISTETIQGLVKNLQEATYYLCGPNQLIDALKTGLTQAGVSPERVRYEKWGEF